MGLKILICGGGIGGLAAAGYLRPQHKVTVLERGGLDDSHDYGLSIVTNTFKLLTNSGIRKEDLDAVTLTHLWTMDEKCQPVRVMDFTKMGVAPSILTRRSGVKREMLRLATEIDRPGDPARIITGAKMVEVDVETGKVTLEDGRVMVGDLIIGADGIQSRVRAAICGHPLSSHAIQSHDLLSFQTQVPLAVVKAQPDLKFLHDPIGRAGIASFSMQDSDATSPSTSGVQPLKRMLAYHTSPSALQIVGFAGEREFAAQFDQAKTSIIPDVPQRRVVDEYDGTFAPSLVSLFKHSRIDAWRLRDIVNLETWWRGKAVLLGDAAHATTPHAGQGCNITIEDAEALGFLLRDVTFPDQLPNALDEYVKMRKARAELVQRYSRQLGGLQTEADRALGDISEKEFQSTIYSYQGIEMAFRAKRAAENSAA